MPPTSTASKHRLTTASGQDAPCERSRQRFWSIPLTEQSSTYTVPRSGRVGCKSVRRSLCGTLTTFEASLLTKATTAELRESLRTVGVRPLIKHRVFAPYHHAHNARIDDERYHQRSTTESVNSSLKRSHGSAVRARDWFRQFREIALIAGVHNVVQAIES